MQFNVILTTLQRAVGEFEVLLTKLATKKFKLDTNCSKDTCVLVFVYLRDRHDTCGHLVNNFNI